MLGIVILCVLSYTLFISLSGAVIAFLLALVAISLIYGKFINKTPIENDLIVDYSTRKG